MHAIFDLKDAVTLSLASIGAVLGVLNTWRAYDRDRPRLRVIPKHAIPVGGADPRLTFCIEVINLSTFPLTVAEVGLLYHGTKQRAAIVYPALADGGGWPRRLEARSAVTAYLSGEGLDARTHRIRCAYAKTDCGLTFEGTTPALRQLAGQGRTAQ